MKKSFKLILTLLLSLCLVSCIAGLVACGNGGGGGTGGGTTTDLGEVPYEAEFLTGKNEIEGYNNNLFYVNTLDFEVADPTVIYISDEKSSEYGYFYAYGTSDEIGCHGFQAWRSKDLSHWECMGVALQPDFANTWAYYNYWAPEIIYDGGIYYLFYNAFNSKDNNHLYLSVAYSRHPAGPFVAPGSEGNMTDANGNPLTPTKPVFDFTANNPIIANLGLSDSRLVRTDALDASPFIDPVSGKKYMYFSYYNNYGEGSFLYGVEMKNWFTPDYSTLKIITAPNYKTVEGWREGKQDERLSEGNVNEGPFMMYKDGKYYMTLSIFGYRMANYRVIQAVSDSPLGSFTKLSDAEGGKVISTAADWEGYMVSAGHHCFFYCGDELFIGYHTFKNRSNINGGRALAVDKVVWADNKDGLPVLHTNGPTHSVQALPEFISGYKNIAPSAKIKANNTADGSDVALLNDELVKYQSGDIVTEYHANSGKSTITISWDDWKTVRAIMVFNSYDYNNTFVDISKVEFEVKTSNNKSAKAVIKNLPFDWEWNMRSGTNKMNPGGAAIAEFNEIPVKSITITVQSVPGFELALGEIIVLGKDQAVAGVDALQAYSYSSFVPEGAPTIVNESEVFGDVDGTPYETWWGYDLSHDDGTENAYIEQLGCTDQYAYFKDVLSEDFYVEAEFTIPTTTPYAGDPWPKFGIAMSVYHERPNNAGAIDNTLFFYVDAADNYTKPAVGCAQRRLDNSDWDWVSTEQLVTIAGLTYTRGSYVKLAVLKQGTNFFMFCNDKLAIFYDQFHTFTEGREVAFGFLCFNTHMKIRNYSYTLDAEFIASESDKYIKTLRGDNIGRAGTNVTTSGWDLSGDHGEDPVLKGSGSADQWAFFKDVETTEAEATATFTVHEVYNNDAFPKFGLVLRNSGATLFFYVDASAGLTAQRVGWVLGNGSGLDWKWVTPGSSDEIDYAVGSYTNDSTVELSIIRDGASIKLLVNGEVVFDLANVEGFGADTSASVGMLTFNLGVSITEYSCTVKE